MNKLCRRELSLQPLSLLLFVQTCAALWVSLWFACCLQSEGGDAHFHNAWWWQGILLPLCRRVGECVSASQELRLWFSMNCLSSPGCHPLPCANTNTCAFMHQAGLGNWSCWKILCMMFLALFFLTRPVHWSGSPWDCTKQLCRGWFRKHEVTCFHGRW